MATVKSLDQKQISLPHTDDFGDTNDKQDRVIRFDPETKTAEVSDEAAAELVRLFPRSVSLVEEAPKAKPKAKAKAKPTTEEA